MKSIAFFLFYEKKSCLGMPSFKFTGDTDTNDSTTDDKKIAFIHYGSTLKDCYLQGDKIFKILKNQVSFASFFKC